MCILFESVKAPPEMLNEFRNCYGSPAGTATTEAFWQTVTSPLLLCDCEAWATSMKEPRQVQDGVLLLGNCRLSAAAFELTLAAVFAL